VLGAPPPPPPLLPGVLPEEELLEELELLLEEASFQARERHCLAQSAAAPSKSG